MRYIMLALLMIIAPWCAQGQVQEIKVSEVEAPVNPITLLEARARQALAELLVSHPGSMAGDLDRWYGQGRLLVEFDPSGAPAQTSFRSVGTGLNGNVHVPVLTLNPNFFVRTKVIGNASSVEEEMKMKMVVLEGAYAQLKDHFSGTNPFITDEERLKADPELLARWHWRYELVSLSAQWNRAKEFGFAEKLNPRLGFYVKEYGEPLGLMIWLIELSRNHPKFASFTESWGFYAAEGASKKK